MGMHMFLKTIDPLTRYIDSRQSAPEFKYKMQFPDVEFQLSLTAYQLAQKRKRKNMEKKRQKRREGIAKQSLSLL